MCSSGLGEDLLRSGMHLGSAAARSAARALACELSLEDQSASERMLGLVRDKALWCIANRWSGINIYLTIKNDFFAGSELSKLISDDVNRLVRPDSRYVCVVYQTRRRAARKIL
jgi:hypothetical protein